MVLNMATHKKLVLIKAARKKRESPKSGLLAPDCLFSFSFSFLGVNKYTITIVMQLQWTNCKMNLKENVLVDSLLLPLCLRLWLLHFVSGLCWWGWVIPLKILSLHWYWPLCQWAWVRPWLLSFLEALVPSSSKKETSIQRVISQSTRTAHLKTCIPQHIYQSLRLGLAFQS